MAGKVCPACGELNGAEQAYCIACSGSLKGVAVTGTPEREKAYDLFGGRTACAKCGEPLPESGNRCKACGEWNTRVRLARRPASAPLPSAGGPEGCAVVLLIVAMLLIPLVGLIVGGIFAFSDDEDKRAWGMLLLAIGLGVIGFWFLVGLLA